MLHAQATLNILVLHFPKPDTFGLALNTVWAQVVEEGTVKLKHVRLLGRPDSVKGLAIFPPFSTPGSPSAQQQVQLLLSSAKDGHAAPSAGNHTHSGLFTSQAHRPAVICVRHSALCVNELGPAQDSSRDKWLDKPRAGNQSNVCRMLSRDTGHRQCRMPFHHAHKSGVVCTLQVATPKRDLPTADLLLCVYLPGLPPEQLSLRVRPGAPQHMRLRPDHPWSHQVGLHHTSAKAVLSAN